MLTADHPISLACKVLSCARSSYYHQGTEPEEAELKAAIEAVVADWPTYGSRRVTANCDGKVRLLHDFVYLAVIMDVFTRNIRGWHLGRSLDQSLTLTALRRALAHRTPTIHHSDQGVQYAATAYTQMLQYAGVQISMADIGQAWQNGHAERLIRTIKEEEVNLFSREPCLKV